MQQKCTALDISTLFQSFLAFLLPLKTLKLFPYFIAFFFYVMILFVLLCMLHCNFATCQFRTLAMSFSCTESPATFVSVWNVYLPKSVHVPAFMLNCVCLDSNVSFLYAFLIFLTYEAQSIHFCQERNV